MKTVWVVSYINSIYDQDRCIVKVYSTEEAANAYVSLAETQANEVRYYDVDEFEVET